MKSKIILVVCVILFGIICCQKEDKHVYRSNGKITGADYRMCPSPCCSGWFIEIDNLTYEFDSIPNNSDINLQKDSFPILVKLDWQLSDKFDCPNKRIVILKIAKQ